MTKYCDVHGAVTVSENQAFCGSVLESGTICGTKLKATPEEIVRRAIPTPVPQSQATQEDSLRRTNADVRARQLAFLMAYGKTCSIQGAADACEIARSTHFRWMKDDPEYPHMFADAKDLAHQILKDSAVEKSIVGWDEPVFHEGKQCGVIRKRSDRLHEVLLRGAFKSEFSDRHEVTGKDGEPLSQGSADVRAVILTALEAFPEAKEALARRLLELDKAGK
jgi:hypothetical protein